MNEEKTNNEYKISSANIAREVVDNFNDAVSCEETEREIWKECLEYCNNWVDGKLGQWKEDVRRNLGDQKKALSFNIIRKFVNRMCGHQRQMKVSEKLFPIDDKTDHITAEILTECGDVVYRDNEFEMHAARVYRNGVITSRGYVKVEYSNEFSTEEEPEAKIVVRSIDPFSVYFIGRGERLDLLDTRGIIEKLYLDKEQIIALNPEKKREIEHICTSAETGKNYGSVINAGGTDYSQLPTSSEEGTKPASQYEVYDKKLKKYVVLRQQFVEYIRPQPKPVAQPAPMVPPMSMNGQMPPQEMGIEKAMPQAPMGQEIPLSNTSVAEGGMVVQNIPEKENADVPKRKIRIKTVFGDVLLQDMYSVYKHNRFDIIPFFCYTDGGRTTSPVQDLIDPQDEKNKRRSAINHYLARSPMGVKLVQKGTFTDIQDANKRASEGHAFIEVNQLNGIENLTNDFSALQILSQLEKEASAEMNEISGISEAATGMVPSGVKSGRGIQALQIPTEIVLSEVWENFLFFRKIVRKMVTMLVQQFWNEPKIIRVVGDYSEKYITEEQQQLIQQGVIQIQNGSKTIQINNPENALTDITAGKYDFAIETINQSPTFMEQKFGSMLEARQMGIPISNEAIVKSSSWAGKGDIIRDLEKTQQQMMQQQLVAGQAQLVAGVEKKKKEAEIDEEKEVSVYGKKKGIDGLAEIAKQMGMIGNGEDE